MVNKVGIIDADLLDKGTRHPNLALMKISGYLQELGKTVSLIENYQDIEQYDKVYISKVFSFTNVPESVLRLKNVRFGGTGFERGINHLPYNIEHHMPDYGLYGSYIKNQIDKGISKDKFVDYLKFSIGFTTRGCFRHCDFCVNKKYNEVVEHSKVSEFLDPHRFGIYLWDDNFLGFHGWEGILDQLIKTGKPFQFRQGLDLRLMTEKKAKKLASAKYHGDFIFAFDNIEDEEIIKQKLQLWRTITSKNTKLFVLCGYKSLDLDDIINTLERIKIIMSYGCVPYIMRYEDYSKSKYSDMYIQLARWCNQPQFFKKISFREYCVANQEYQENKYARTTINKCYKTMLDFEKENPDIAKKYFDLRFEKECNFFLPDTNTERIIISEVWNEL